MTILLITLTAGPAFTAGSILLQNYNKELFVLDEAGQRSRPLPAAPGIYGKVFFNGRDTLILSRIFPKPGKIWVVDLQSGKSRVYPFSHKQVRHNRIIKYGRWLPKLKTHLYIGLDNYASYLFAVQGSSRRQPAILNRYQGKLFNFDILENGSLLATRNAAFTYANESRLSSRYFGDMLTGKPQQLLYWPSLSGKAGVLAERPAIYRAYFCNNGKGIAFLSAVKADPGANSKFYALEYADLATGTVQKIAEIKTPITLPNGRKNLGNPRLLVCRTAALAVHLSEDKKITVYDLKKRRESVLQLPDGAKPVDIFPDSSNPPHVAGTLISPALVVSSWLSRGKYKLQAIDLRSSRILTSRVFTGSGVLAAAWLPGKPVQGGTASGTDDPYEQDRKQDPFEND